MRFFFKYVFYFITLLLVFLSVINMQHKEGVKGMDGFDANLTGNVRVQQQTEHGHLAASGNEERSLTKLLPEHKHNRKYQVVKFISIEIILPETPQAQPLIFFDALPAHTPRLPKVYNYLFFREINPPPPDQLSA